MFIATKMPIQRAGPVAARDESRPCVHGQAYEALRHEIQSGRLLFRFFLGQTGGGSTALTMWLARHYFDLAVSEPDSLLLRRNEPPLSHADRLRHKQNMYQYLWDTYSSERASKGDDSPISMVCKFMPHLWYNDDTMRELLELDGRPIWLIRHPSLALSSWFDKRIALLRAGVEVGIGDSLSPKDSETLQSMTRTRDYSNFPKSLWDLIENHLYEGNLDQDIRSYHEYPKTARPGESVRLDRLRMVVGDRRLREYNDIFVTEETWKDAVNTQTPRVIDFELFQYDQDQIARAVIEPRWGMTQRTKVQAEQNPGRFVDPYLRFNRLSEILMEPQVSGAAIHPPKMQPIEVGRFPPDLRPGLIRGAELYYQMIAASGLAFPAYQATRHRNLGEVFGYNSVMCTGPGGRAVTAAWNNLQARLRTDRGRVSAPPGSFGLS